AGAATSAMGGGTGAFVPHAEVASAREDRGTQVDWSGPWRRRCPRIDRYMHLGAHFVTRLTDRRTTVQPERIRRSTAFGESRHHRLQRAPGDTAPPGVDQPDHTRTLGDEEDRNAIGRGDREQNTRKAGQVGIELVDDAEAGRERGCP